MEVVRRWWWTFALGLGALLEEACFRLVLAAEVLIGRVPRPAERRWWNRAAEVPTLIDVHDSTSDRLLFSVLVWPPLESDAATAERDHRQRVEEVLDAIARGATEKMWSVQWQLDYGLRWDHERQVWTGEDGFAYDGAGFAARRSHAS